MKTGQQREIFERTFRAMYPKVKAFAFKMLKSGAEAEDTAQEVFAKLWKNPQILEREEALPGYIYSMTRNHILNIVKHQAVQIDFKEYAVHWQNYCNSEDMVHNSVYANEIALLTMMTVKAMPEQRRKVFIMSRSEGLGNEEIAKRTGLSQRTVERHIYLALKELKDVLLVFFSIFATNL